MPSPTFHCPSCLFSFDQLHWLVAHLLELNCAALLAHGGGPPTEFNCTLCGHRLFSCQQLADHLKLCHSHEQATNENAEEVIETDLLAEQQSSQQVAEATTMFVDQQPGQEQQRRQRTARHQCQSCDRAFPKLVDLRRHERTHTGERPFGCPQCQRHFKLKQTLESHLKTHREARPEEHFECSVCAKKFLSRSALRLHLRIHTDERPFNCAEPLCADTFRTKKLMLTHYRNCHQNNIDNDDNSQSQHETQTLDVQHGRLPEKGRLETRAQREAAYALLKLNPRMGARAKKARLNRSEHSAFSEYNKAGAGTIQLQIASHSHQLIQSVPVGYCDSAAVAQHSLSENMQTTNCSSQHQQQQQQQMIQLQQEQSVQSVPVGYCDLTTAQQSAPCSLSATSCPSQHQQQLAQLQQQQQQQQSAVACTSGLNVMSAFPFGSSAAVPNNQQQAPLAFFQTADAEYTREGQVHNRRQNPLPSQQFRTLTPPLTFMYYYSDSQQQEAMMRPTAVGFIHPQQQHQPQLCPLQPMHQQQQSTENQGQQQQPGHLRNY